MSSSELVGQRNRRGFALIEILVVLVIILVLAGGYLGLRGKGKSNEKSVPVRAMQKAESVECQSNLNQIRQSVMMDTQTGEAPPARIDTGATASISKCPISGQPYGYDPQTGKVWCTTPGHEKY